MSCCCQCDRMDQPRPHIDAREDRPFHNLSEVHFAGADGLNAVFTLGSVWEYGPFVGGLQPTVLRVVGPAYTSRKNYSKCPEDAAALGKPCWFIKCEVVSSPTQSRPVGCVTGFPPHTLVPVRQACCCCPHAALAAVMAERDSLREQLRGTSAAWSRAAEEAERANAKLEKVRTALSR